MFCDIACQVSSAACALTKLGRFIFASAVRNTVGRVAKSRVVARVSRPSGYQLSRRVLRVSEGDLGEKQSEMNESDSALCISLLSLSLCSRKIQPGLWLNAKLQESGLTLILSSRYLPGKHDGAEENFARRTERIAKVKSAGRGEADLRLSCRRKSAGLRTRKIRIRVEALARYP